MWPIDGIERDAKGGWSWFVRQRYSLMIDSNTVRYVTGDYRRLARVVHWLRYHGHALYINDEQGMQIQV